jgi:hypothetical protein
MASGKVAALAVVVSVYDDGDGSALSVAWRIALICGALQSWRRYGLPT